MREEASHSRKGCSMGIVCNTSVFSTHPFMALKTSFENRISVHIAICESTSKNVYVAMSYCTIISSE